MNIASLSIYVNGHNCFCLFIYFTFNVLYAHL
ncbi:Uncharacterised protein [Vibrio cholerae]|nr:Uncharacterised protein [Vibrio cholerae]